MSWYMMLWVVYTIAVSGLALLFYANDRDEQKLSAHYRRKWREAVERSRT